MANLLFSKLYPTKIIYPKILRNINQGDLAHEITCLERKINLPRLLFSVSRSPCANYRYTCTKADFDLLIKVGNIILFTAITHIWVIYTFIIDYLHENNILMLVIHFEIHLDSID